MASKILAVRVLSWLLRGVKALLLSFIALFALSALLAGFKDVDRYPIARRVMSFEAALEKPAAAAIKTLVPTNFRGQDITGWLLLGGVYFLSIGFGVGGAALREKASRLERQRDGGVLGKVGLKTGKLGRSELLEIYAETKKSLEQQKRYMAFLSIDIVDSTGMKIGEDVGIAERDFRQYKHMVEKILKSNHALKETWTPDGVMICFGATADAVRAAQAVIAELESFNRSVKAIKRDFAIRAGINAGEVFADESTPMEEMTDRVIDIAGHMQKHGVVDGVCISGPAILPLLKEFPFTDAGRSVDGCAVYEWRRGQRAAA